MKLNVVYSSDDKYSEYMGISILSLLKNNNKFQEINIYILDNKISKSNKDKILSIGKVYGRKIIFIKFDEIETVAGIKLSNDRSLSMYSRLFLSKTLPNTIEKVIYMDCDSLVLGDLSDLWRLDINSYLVAGVNDIVPNAYKESIGIINRNYINSGFMLINLKKWRQDDIESKMKEFIYRYKGNVPHHDQGIINGVMNNEIYLIEPKYNSITPFFEHKYEKLIKLYRLLNYYDKEEILDAVENPVFVHFVPSFSQRPWIKGCKHPMKNKYFEYKQQSPWKDVNLKEDNSKWVTKIVRFIYNYLPFYVLYYVIGTIEYRKNIKMFKNKL